MQIIENYYFKIWIEFTKNLITIVISSSVNSATSNPQNGSIKGILALLPTLSEMRGFFYAVYSSIQAMLFLYSWFDRR